MTNLRGYRGPCSVQGCERPVRSSYGRKCERCRQRTRRMGDPRMLRGVTLHELKPYLRQVRSVIRRGKAEAIQQALASIQTRLADTVRDELAERNSITFRGPDWLLTALHETARVLAEIEPVASGRLIAGLHLMRHQNPRRWPSDKAFTYSVVTRWRKQAQSIAFGSYYHSTKGKTVTTYKDLRPATVEAIGEMLTLAYTPFVARVLEAVSANSQQVHTAAVRAKLDEGFSPTTRERPQVTRQ